MKLTNRLYLIGMPGSGKSFFAKVLAEYYNCIIIDLDKAIEESEGKTIPEIFSENGEEHFRDIEAKKLREVTESNDSIIISTGGGTPCFHDSMKYMNQNGVTVFLHTDLDVIIERVSKKEDRPLLAGDVEKRIHELLKQRLPIYEKAQITIEHRDPGLLSKEILNLKS